VISKVVCLNISIAVIKALISSSELSEIAIAGYFPLLSYLDSQIALVISSSNSFSSSVSRTIDN